MKEPRRWLEDTSPETYELRLLLQAAEKPRFMNADERLRAAEQMEALEARASLPVHRFLPDLSSSTQWFADLLEPLRSTRRAKRRARLFALVVVVLVMVALAAAAAPLAAHWWNTVISRNSAEEKIKPPLENGPHSPTKVRLEKPNDPGLVARDPSSLAAEPEAPAVAPLSTSAPAIPTAKKSGDPLRGVQADDVPDEPIVPPLANPSPSAPSVIPRQETRITAEVTLMNKAQTLVTTNPSEALKILKQHEQEFPSGLLRFTREQLITEALRNTGQVSEARARAKANLEGAQGQSTEGKFQQQIDSLQ
jgi:hypothetical protein